MNAASLRRRVRVALGREPADLLLRGGQVVNVFRERVERADVVIADGVVVAVGRDAWTATETIDVADQFVAPGLIDAHMHIESTLLTPAELARVVAPRGTSAVIADPHEIANVMGVRGIELMLAASAGLPVDCFFMAPSCVPASPFENAGARLEADDLDGILGHERVLGLAEMMNFPGVLAGDESVLDKIARAHTRGKVVDGHAPGLSGREIVAYAAAGIRSDHECTTVDEAQIRADLGMLVQVREGSMARNLDTMLPRMAAGELGAWCLCTDDVLPEDLTTGGHLDTVLARVVAGGVNAATAIRHAALVPAQHYGLPDRGAVSPGYRADLVVFDSMTHFRPGLVLHGGEVVARDGAPVGDIAAPAIPSENTVHIGPLDPGDLQLHVGAGPQLVIRVVPDQIVTERESRTVRAESGRWVFDADEDIALVACVQRHAPTGASGVGLVAGFGFRERGAIGSSVGHDAHNLVIAGTHAEELVACARAIEAIGGGFVVIRDGSVVAELPLPVAGLMSMHAAPEVCRQQRAVDEAAAALGCTLHSPFGTLSFLPLTVIPQLRITDAGLFDVDRFALVKS